MVLRAEIDRGFTGIQEELGILRDAFLCEEEEHRPNHQHAAAALDEIIDRHRALHSKVGDLIYDMLEEIA